MKTDPLEEILKDHDRHPVRWGVIYAIAILGLMVFMAADANEPHQGGGESASEAASEANADADANAQADSDSSATAGSDVSLSVNRDFLSIGGSSAPRTIDPDNPCVLPRNGIFKRGTRWLFGAFEISPTAEFDEACWDKMIAYERAITERIRAQLAFQEAMRK